MVEMYLVRRGEYHVVVKASHPAERGGGLLRSSVVHASGRFITKTQRPWREVSWPAARVGPLLQFCCRTVPGKAAALEARRWSQLSGQHCLTAPAMFLFYELVPYNRPSPAF